MIGHALSSSPTGPEETLRPECRRASRTVGSSTADRYPATTSATVFPARPRSARGARRLDSVHGDTSAEPAVQMNPEATPGRRRAVRGSRCWRAARRAGDSGGGDHDHEQQQPERRPEDREDEHHPVVGRGEVAAGERVFDLALADHAEHDAQDPQRREAGAGDRVGPLDLVVARAGEPPCRPRRPPRSTPGRSSTRPGRSARWPGGSAAWRPSLRLRPACAGGPGRGAWELTTGRLAVGSTGRARAACRDRCERPSCPHPVRADAPRSALARAPLPVLASGGGWRRRRAGAGVELRVGTRERTRKDDVRRWGTSERCWRSSRRGSLCVALAASASAREGGEHPRIHRQRDLRSRAS